MIMLGVGHFKLYQYLRVKPFGAVGSKVSARFKYDLVDSGGSTRLGGSRSLIRPSALVTPWQNVSQSRSLFWCRRRMLRSRAGEPLEVSSTCVVIWLTGNQFQSASGSSFFRRSTVILHAARPSRYGFPSRLFFFRRSCSRRNIFGRGFARGKHDKNKPENGFHKSDWRQPALR